MISVAPQRLDVFASAQGDLIRLDLSTGETRRWTADRAIDFLGYSAGYALARLYDYDAEVRTGQRDGTIYKLILNDDGSVEVAGIIRTAE